MVTQIFKKPNCDFITKTGLLNFFFQDSFSNIRAALVRWNKLKHDRKMKPS